MVTIFFAFENYIIDYYYINIYNTYDYFKVMSEGLCLD